MQKKKPRRLIPLTKWNQFHLWPTIGGLRHLVAFAKQKNFEQVFIRANGRILVDEEAFFLWLSDSGKGGYDV
jgi:hypothetical protein